MRDARWCLCLVLLLGVARMALAQPAGPANGIFVVAKPSLRDPNFAETVVLVTQAGDGGTVGVIVNRPTQLTLKEMLPELESGANYREPVYFGGPVMPQVVVALFRSSEAPKAPAFHVLRDLYLTMHPDNISRLLSEPGHQYRLYAGFSAWAPRQLESEFGREGWYILPADDASVFRRDPQNLWRELVRKAEMRPVRGALRQELKMKSPAVGGAVARIHRAALQEQRSLCAATAAPETRRCAASFCAALISRCPDGRPGSRFVAARRPDRGGESRLSI